MAEVDKIRHADIAAVLDIPLPTVAYRLRTGWGEIETTLRSRRLSDQIPAVILAGGLTSTVALSAQAQQNAWRRVSLRIASRRCVRAAAAVCVAGMIPMSGAGLPARSDEAHPELARAREQAVVSPKPAPTAESGDLLPAQAPGDGSKATSAGGPYPAGRRGQAEYQAGEQAGAIGETATAVHLQEPTNHGDEMALVANAAGSGNSGRFRSRNSGRSKLTST